LPTSDWRTTYPRAIDPEEISFIDRVDDLINVVSVSKTPCANATERFIDSVGTLFSARLNRFRDIESDEKPPSTNMTFHDQLLSDKFVDQFFTFVVCFGGLIMLIHHYGF